jgi:hypothetical protein
VNRSDEWADHLDPAATDPALPTAHRERLDRFAAVLADEAVWSEPPVALREGLLARAAQEGREGRGPAPARPRGSARVWWWSVGGLAAAAALVVALAWPRPHPETTFALSGTGRAPTASASAQLTPRPAGVAITLHVRGLAPAPPAHYYAAWLRGPDGVVPVGSFHWRVGGMPISLWSGVLPDRYPELFVTLQAEGDPPAPSADVVLSGSATGRPPATTSSSSPAPPFGTG